ncbi:DUF4232 domain-containing protein [Kitasatospora sp. NPDC096147]|uniref:DUF4232 domain-containing protein n=1 Tax=Kitasatospora sp. NPDC096147 TaxID=3364093 RepID=UPI003813A97F
MHSSRSILPLALAGLFALTACGSRPAVQAGGPALPPDGGGECAVAAAGRVAGGAAGGAATPGPITPPVPTAPGKAGRDGTAAPGRAARAVDGVRITAADRSCFEFEVSNPEAEGYLYTVTFALGSPVMDNLTRVVPFVGAGQTVRDAVKLTGIQNGSAEPSVAKVRSVPAAEAPPVPGNCPPSGLRLTADEGSAAMGLRAVGLLLENCGPAPVRLNGFPALEPLGLDHRPVADVAVLPGGSAIAGGTGAEDTAREFELLTGESARSVITWRNTVTEGTPVLAPYVRVRALPGAAPVMVTPELDLGTTGRLGAGAWVKV